MKNGIVNNNICVSSVQFSKKQVTKEKIKELKSKLISTGRYDLYRNCQKAMYYQSCLLTCDNYNYDYYTDKFNQYQKYLNYDSNFTKLEKKCCIQLFNSHRQKVLRLKKKLKKVILFNDCLFLTLTFTNHVLENTSSKTRRTYITRFLKQLLVPFAMANIDYGDKDKNPLSKEREHYHAIVQSSHIDLTSYKYGLINVEHIRCFNGTVDKLSHYVNKLSYHTYKQSTGYNKVIYIKNSYKKCLQLSL